MTLPKHSKSLPCRIGWHKWRASRRGLYIYSLCIDCGKERG